MTEQFVQQQKTVNQKKRQNARWRIVAGIFAAVLGVCLLFFIIRSYQRRQYEYIDLPIVLSNEKEVVGVIRDGLTTHNNRITIQFTAKGQYQDQITTLTAGLVAKALEPTDDPKQGDYIRFQYGGYRVRYSNPQNAAGSYDYTIKILPTYYTTLGREEAVDQAVAAYLSESKFTRRTSDYEKIKTAHDYLTAHCEYDWRNSRLLHRYTKATAYGALINGEASCQGYSVAMYRLLRESGVDCRIVTGFATSPETGIREYHAWDLVALDGKWYNVDVAWDDEMGNLDYFLKADASFTSHVRDAEYDAASFRAAHPMSEEDYSAGTS